MKHHPDIRASASRRKNDLYGIYEGFLLPIILGLTGARPDARSERSALGWLACNTVYPKASILPKFNTA